MALKCQNLERNGIESETQNFPVSSPDNDPGIALALNFRALSIGTIHRNSASLSFSCLDSNRGILEASYLDPPLIMPRNALSPEYGHPGASPLVRCRGSTADSLSRTPQRVSPRCTSSNTCFYRAPGSLPPYGQSGGSSSTDLFPPPL